MTDSKIVFAHELTLHLLGKKFKHGLLFGIVAHGHSRDTAAADAVMV
ncbi:MAG: hypothetical protein ABII93_03540 [Chrysiogenia bacterium]